MNEMDAKTLSFFNVAHALIKEKAKNEGLTETQARRVLERALTRVFRG